MLHQRIAHSQAERDGTDQDLRGVGDKLKMAEVERFELTPLPVPFGIYYSV